MLHNSNEEAICNYTVNFQSYLLIFDEKRWISRYLCRNLLVLMTKWAVASAHANSQTQLGVRKVLIAA